MAYEYVQEYINENYVVLDVCCGLFHPTRFLVCKSLIGVDIWNKDSFVEEAKKYCDLLMIFDFSKNSWIFPNKSVDVVVCLEGIEHVDKERSIKFLEEFERIARKKIIITTPSIFNKNEEIFLNPNHWAFENDYDTHKCLWSVEEFLSRGYETKIILNNKILAVKEMKL